MLYIIKRLNDLNYLSSFEDIQKPIPLTFIPLESDALKLPCNVAERYMRMICEIEHDNYEIIPAK